MKPHRHTWIWGAGALTIGIGSLGALYASLQTGSRAALVFVVLGSAVAIVFAIVGWRSRPRQRRFGPMVLALAAILTGVAGIAGTIADARTFVDAATTANLADATTADSATQVIDGAAAQHPVPGTDPSSTARPPATQTSMARALGTLAYELEQARGGDGLQSPNLAVTEGGAVVDPFSATPERVLAVLPAGTVLSYTVSVDRRNYAMTLTDSGEPDLIVRYDSIGHVVHTD